MDLFRANGKMGRGQELFHYWMKENLRADRPYDDVVRDIIAASAKSNHVVAASNVIAREHVQGKPQPDDGDDWGMVQQLDTHDELNVLYSQRFLGLNLSCISCHDGQGHLEKVNTWLSKKRRSDFYRGSAFLGRNRYLMYWEDGKPQSGEFLIDDAAPGYDTKGASMIRVPRFGGPADPAFILTGEKPRPGEETRDSKYVLGEADGLGHRRTLRRLRPRPSGPGLASGIARCARGGFREKRLPPQASVPDHHAIQRLPPFVAVPRRMEGIVRPLLCPQVRPATGRRGSA
jgi:hypothetical protein